MADVDDYDEWQIRLLTLCEKLAQIESSRTHAIYSNNTNKYANFIKFRQIDKFDLVPDAVEALTAFDKKSKGLDATDLNNLTSNPIDDKTQKAKSKKMRPFTSVGRGAKKQHLDGDDWALKFKLVHADSRLVTSILQAHDFDQTEGHDWNILWTNTIGKPYLYTGLNEFQKVNHFPSSYEITRKNNLASNVLIMQNKFGKKEFDIIPETYVLPDEFSEFFNCFKKRQENLKHYNNDNLWIVKANALSRGRGIYLIDDPSQVNMESPCIISKYVSNPLLINGHKFDLRLYVVVTCFDPLRIYLYNEGLARFCTEKYNLGKSLGNKFIHLTNYSINKKNTNFVQNVEEDEDDYGFKWSLTALLKHLKTIG